MTDKSESKTRKRVKSGIELAARGLLILLLVGTSVYCVLSSGVYSQSVAMLSGSIMIIAGVLGLAGHLIKSLVSNTLASISLGHLTYIVPPSVLLTDYPTLVFAAFAIGYGGLLIGITRLQYTHAKILKGDGDDSPTIRLRNLKLGGETVNIEFKGEVK